MQTGSDANRVANLFWGGGGAGGKVHTDGHCRWHAYQALTWNAKSMRPPPQPVSLTARRAKKAGRGGGGDRLGEYCSALQCSAGDTRAPGAAIEGTAWQGGERRMRDGARCCCWSGGRQRAAADNVANGPDALPCSGEARDAAAVSVPPPPPHRPHHPPLSQSTSCCSDRLTSWPVAMAFTPSMAPVAENAQQLPGGVRGGGAWRHVRR